MATSEQCCSECPQRGVVRGYSQLGEVAAKGLHLQVVVGDTANENYRVLHLLACNNGADVVGSIALMEASDDVPQRLTFVLQVNHV